MEKHLQLQQKINEIIYPNIEDRVLINCLLINHKTKQIFLIFDLDGKIIKIKNLEINNYFDEHISNVIKRFEVLGLPINLERLYLALLSFHQNAWVYSSSGSCILVQVSVLGYTDNIKFEYDLRKDFSRQIPKTKNKIYKLFNL